jgi:hypothetical protein
MEIATTQQYVPSVAERGKFFPLDRSYLDSIGYPVSGEGKYCVLTYNVSPITVDIAGSDIQIGAVELKDADSDARVKIAAADTMPTSANALAVADANVLEALNNLDVSSTTIFVAQSGVPTPVSSGTSVNAWSDTYGRQILAGYNLALAALDTNQVNQAVLNRLGPITNLNGVTATGAGTSVDVSNYHNITFQIVASSVTSGATITIEHSLDGTNWATLNTSTISASGVSEYRVSEVAYKYVRTNVIEYNDLSQTERYTTYIYAGN